MGSISSRPAVPSQPQVVYVPAPASTPTTTASTSTSSSSSETASSQNEGLSASEARTAGLLQRDRSRFGTITTGFRGLLSQITNGNQRKTLLGE